MSIFQSKKMSKNDENKINGSQYFTTNTDCRLLYTIQSGIIKFVRKGHKTVPEMDIFHLYIRIIKR